MVPPAFGFSVGDFLAVTSLIVKIVQVLQGTSDDIRQLKAIGQQLTHLKSVLDQIALVVSDGTAISVKNVGILAKTCADCRTLLMEFESFVDEYLSTSPGLAKYRKKIKYVVASKKKQVDSFQKSFQQHTSTIILIQNELNRNEIQQLKSEITNQTNVISTRIQTGAEEMRLQLHSLVREPWDQKPIDFQDATGRRYPIPLEAVTTFDDFMTFLSFTFRGRSESALIDRREIWLFTPALSTDKWWYLLTDSDWPAMMRPGVHLEMSLNLNSFTTAATKTLAGSQSAPVDRLHQKKIASPEKMVSCQFCQQDELRSDLDHQGLCRNCSPKGYALNSGSPFSEVRFSTPMPPWTRLPADLEFRWMSTVPDFGPISTKRRLDVDSADCPSSPLQKFKDKSSVACFQSLQCYCGPSFSDADLEAALSATA